MVQSSPGCSRSAVTSRASGGPGGRTGWLGNVACSTPCSEACPFVVDLSSMVFLSGMERGEGGTDAAFVAAVRGGRLGGEEFAGGRRAGAGSFSPLSTSDWGDGGERSSGRVAPRPLPPDPPLRGGEGGTGAKFLFAAAFRTFAAFRSCTAGGS